MGKIFKNRQAQRVALLLVLGIGVVINFQNCGKAGFESQSDLASMTGTVQPAGAGISASPFPFEASANVISYMSCPTSAQSNNPEGFYNFKIAASDTGAINTIVNSYNQSGATSSGLSVLNPMASAGMHLRPDFLTYIDQNFKGLKTQATPEQLATAIATHPDYKYARLQLSLRSQGDVRNTFLNAPGQTAPVAQWIGDILSAPLMSQTLANSRDQLITSFPKNSLEPMPIRSSVLFSSPSEIDMGNFRSLIEREYYLALAFVRNDGQNAANAQLVAYPAGVSGIYGRGYKLQFSYPARPMAVPMASVSYTAGGAAKPRSTLASGTGVMEYNLETGDGIPGTWACLQYGIVRYEDKALCPIENYGSIARDKLDVVRKVLRAEDWQVNTTLGCIVPTSSNSQFSCYNTKGPAPTDEQAVWSSMLSQNLGFGTPYDGDFGGGSSSPGIEYRYWTHNCSGGYRECVNFATFCYKQQ
jgi:hypothetical protein